MDLNSPEVQEINAARGREALLQLWEKYSTTGAPHQICGIAHFLADTETDVALELEWDLRALEGATGSREPEDREALPPVPESFLPSLHISVASCHRRLGDLERARQYMLIAANHIGALADDAYGNGIKAALRRLQTALAIPER